MIDAIKSNATLHLMDSITQLELEAALKYAEAEHSYSYATVSEALHVPERTVHGVTVLRVKQIDYPPQYQPAPVPNAGCPYWKSCITTRLPGLRSSTE